MARRRPAAGDDPLLPGSLALRQHGVGVELRTGVGVFSAAAVDPGTTYLLRWLAGVDAADVLDVGCGYGPLALWLAAADPARRVTAVDRDAVAVECTERGASANGLADRVAAHGSLGYDDVERAARFDLVVSNIPAKVGRRALEHLLLDARHRLRPGGQVAVVVIDRLAGDVGALLASTPDVVVHDHRANRSYSTWTYGFSGPAADEAGPGFERGVYRRGHGRFAAGRVRWEATTSWSLPEFDTLAHGTVAAVGVLERRRLPGPVAVVGVGQGHLPLALRALDPAVELELVDRDLLALRTAAANVGSARLHHVARPAAATTAVASAVVALPEKQPVAVTAALVGDALLRLAPGSPVVVHGRAADVSRVLDLLEARGVRLAVEARRAHAGAVAVSGVTPPA